MSSCNYLNLFIQIRGILNFIMRKLFNIKFNISMYGVYVWVEIAFGRNILENTVVTGELYCLIFNKLLGTNNKYSYNRGA